MTHATNEPTADAAQTALTPSAPSAPPSPWALPEGASRTDGWTGQRMSQFCEALADTGLVVDACLAAGKSTVGAYALRRRNALLNLSNVRLMRQCVLRV